MQRITSAEIALWQFDLFSKVDGIKHFVSGKEGGVSNEKGELNLSFKVGDSTKNVYANRKIITDYFNIHHSNLIIPQQTHSNKSLIVTSNTKEVELEGVDALITQEKGLMIAVLSADCVPILLFDPVQKVSAAIHAGWKGTVAEIVSNTILEMKKHFNVNPENLRAAIGPSICQKNYEVGKIVIDAMENIYSKNQLSEIIRFTSVEKGFCDLWTANRIQLLKHGVRPQHIEVAGICSFDNSNDFFSYRKDQEKAGRYAAGIMLC